MLCHTRLTFCRWFRHPIWEPAHVPVAPLLTQLPINGLGKQVAGPLHLHETWKKLLHPWSRRALATANGNSLCLSFSLSNPDFQVKEIFKTKWNQHCLLGSWDNSYHTAHLYQNWHNGTVHYRNELQSHLKDSHVCRRESYTVVLNKASHPPQHM